ncbi:MAG: peptidoglycan-binding protein [Candidatus Omnitrophica bacterium]|nr:peptidoglycan-binding protein [Candidatus Omnitrophota bacterium]MBU4479113.1 peptidoglycan-binding protein [Candidatus Omnitrophota bacterium]
MIRLKLLLTIIILCAISAFPDIFVPAVQAMGKRPPAKKKTEEKFVLPEIEIITKPEADMRLFSEDKPAKPQIAPLSPKEILPVSEAAAATSRSKYPAGDIQKALSNAGFSVGPIDGKIGPKTKKAIKDFQKQNNLTVDGIVGDKTWEKLKPYLGSTTTKNKN